eukprot:10231949-Heterocapsa_arctica.AAC.1
MAASAEGAQHRPRAGLYGLHLFQCEREVRIAHLVGRGCRVVCGRKEGDRRGHGAPRPDEGC